MKVSLVVALLLSASPVLAQEVIPIEVAPPPSPVTEEPRFVCEFRNGQYVVSYRPENQFDRSFPWALPRALGGGWTGERRCQEIARRLESYRPDGLDELRIGRENGYNTVCATTDRVPACRIVFTVPPGQDPLLTRDRVFANLVSAEQGQLTAPVNTLAGRGLPFTDLLRGQRTTRRRAAIPLKPFLAPQDGGSNVGGNF
jgi:hypothetical protein